MRSAELKRALKRAARAIGLEIRSRLELNGSAMEDGLARQSAHTPIGTVIDVGASDGSWSRLAQRFYPQANYLLIEALSNPHEPALRAFQQSSSARVQYVIAAAGDRIGETTFEAGSDFGGAVTPASSSNSINVPMTTIDVEVEKRRLPGPYLIKLDTHGFEPQILDGAVRTLGSTSLMIVEAYNFRLNDSALMFHELAARLIKDHELRCADICEIMRRPSDRLLWQMDMFFIRSDRTEFSDGRYS
jgi:FkbM family methyltransferase